MLGHKPDVIKDPKYILQQPLLWVFLGMGSRC